MLIYLLVEYNIGLRWVRADQRGSEGYMPIKSNLTKYDPVVAQIHKIAAKKSGPATDEENMLHVVGTIVASLTSGNSYQTSKVLEAGNLAFDNPTVRAEHEQARTSKWKLVRPADFNELATMNLNDPTYMRWLHMATRPDEKAKYIYGWKTLKGIFDQACDSVEVKRN